jgi:hypothetical protein
MDGMKKKCYMCSELIDTVLFYKDRTRSDGLSNRCKDCARKHLRKMSLDHPHIFTEKYKRWYRKNKDKVRKNWKIWYEANKYKVRAHNKVKTALLNGSLVKGICEKCGSSDVRAHHDDYSKPLQVRWLCQRHHMQHHKGKDN